MKPVVFTMGFRFLPVAYEINIAAVNLVWLPPTLRGMFKGNISQHIVLSDSDYSNQNKQATLLCNKHWCITDMATSLCYCALFGAKYFKPRLSVPTK